MADLKSLSSPSSDSGADKIFGSNWNDLITSIKRAKNYNALVGIEGSTVYAIDASGNSIATGTAGTDDSTVIQAAVDNLTAGRSRKEKVVLRGSFTLNTAIVLASYTILEIIGYVTIGNSTGIRNITITNGSTDVEIYGGTLDGNKANNTNGGVDGQQVAIYGSALTNISIHNLTVQNTEREGIYLSNTGWTNYADIYIKSTGLTGLEVDANNYTDVYNVRVLSAGLHGIEVVGGGTRTENNVTLSGCTSYGAQGYGLRVIHARGTKVVGFKARNNGLGASSTHGIIINDCAGVDVVGCKSLESYQDGLFVTGSDRVAITGGSFYNNGQTAANSVGVTFSNTTNSSFTGGKCFDTQGTPTQDYGFYEVGTSNNNFINGCDLNGNSTSAIRGLVGSSTVVKNCNGYNPLGVASITVGASPYTYTNSDGVSEAVYIDAGTVSSIAKNSNTIFTSTGKTVWLEPGESVVVTYTVLPTMMKDRK